MSEFSPEQYVEKWDRIIGPVMIVAIVASIVAVFALNRVTIPDCHVNEMVYCGETPSHHGSDHH